MLARLSIRDIVLIDKLDLDFAKGLAVLAPSEASDFEDLTRLSD